MSLFLSTCPHLTAPGGETLERHIKLALKRGGEAERACLMEITLSLPCSPAWAHGAPLASLTSFRFLPHVQRELKATRGLGCTSQRSW